MTGTHPNPEGDAMQTQPTAYTLIAAMMSALTVAPWHGATVPRDMGLPSIPVQGPLAPDGRFTGTLIMESVTVADAGHLVLTGVLRGTAIRRTGAITPVRGQPFTAPAMPVDDAQTTDVVLLQVAPIVLAAVGRPLTLAPIPLDLESVPEEGLLFPRSPYEGVASRRPLSTPGTSHFERVH
jgi:hypothetical protein